MTSLTKSARMFKLLKSCSKLVDNLGEAVRTQLVDRLATSCEIFTCVDGAIVLLVVRRTRWNIHHLRQGSYYCNFYHDLNTCGTTP